MALKKLSPEILSFLPLVTFLLIYISTGVFLSVQGSEQPFSQFPAPACALVGFAVALILNLKRVGESIDVFIGGISEHTVVLMCLIFLLAGAFATVSKAMGGVDATVQIGLWLLPENLILPGLFLLSCFVSLAMGTSMGTIGAITPIAIGIADEAGLNMPLVLGTILGGAMFGDNLSVISDTTIAATSTQGCQMRDKMLANLRIAIPAALLVTAWLLFLNEPAKSSEVYDGSFIKAMPYFLVLLLAVSGINVIVVLMTGIFAAAFVGVSVGDLSFLEFGRSAYEGFLAMAEVFFLSIFIAGLAAIATRYGGFEYLLRKLTRLIKSKRSAELGTALLVSLTDVCVANNTVAIIVTGKMVRKIAEQYQIAPARAASIIDIFSCVWQGIIPYGPQVLLIVGLANVSPFEIVSNAWYLHILGVVAVLSIVIPYPSKVASS